MSVLRHLRELKDILIVFLTPVILLPIPLCIQGKESACAYVIIMMAVFWVTEALSINITALLPVFLFPLIGVLSAGEVASVFFNSTTLMFTGGMMVAAAIEEWQIHKRVALKILMLIGSRTEWLMLGLMLTAWFLSMWISNTATTAMMIPIANAILEELRKCRGPNDSELELAPELNGALHTGNAGRCYFKPDVDSKRSTIDVDATDKYSGIELGVADKCSDIEMHEIKGCRMNAEEIDNNNIMNGDVRAHDVTPVDTRICKALSLCIAYAANIGGTATLTGTTPNLVLKGQMDEYYDKLGGESPLTFSKWMLFGVPTSFVIVLLSWCWLQVYFLRCKVWSRCRRGSQDDDGANIKEVLSEQYQRLGPVSFGQVAVVCHLVAVALLWITRDMGGSFGWAGLFKDKFIKDSVPAIFIGCLLFVFPSTLPSICCNRPPGNSMGTIKPLLTWNTFCGKMPWGIVLLLGGGFSMAKASQVSGLSSWIGSQLSALGHLEPWCLNLVLCFIIAAATEVTSNTATTSLMLPILADLAKTLGLSPLYLMLPATIAASFAFMLPVATPANAVVFSYGKVHVFDMVKAGSLLNVIGVLVLIGSMESLGRAIF